MSKLGDDLIRSLKEAVARAKGDGLGTEHAPAKRCHRNSHEIDETIDPDESSDRIEQ
jgi:hypothetical protein